MKRIKFIGLFILVFFYIFGPVFRPIGAWMDLIFVTSLMLSFYGVFVAKLKIPRYFSVFFILVFVFAYVLVSISMYPPTAQEDYIRVILIPIRILFTMYGGYVIVHLLSVNYETEYFVSLLKFIFISIVVHATIMAYQFYDPDFKELIYLYTSTGDYRGSNEYNFRMGGLTGNPGDSVLSVVQSLGIIIIPWIYKNVKAYWKILTILGGVLIFYSILICGRSGIWSTIIFLPASIYFSSDNKGIASLIKLVPKVLLFLGFFIAVLFLFDKTEADSPLNYALKRSLDTFLDYKESGSFDDHTVDVLTSHVFLPTDPITLLFGDGEHVVNTQFTRTLLSDIGFVRNIWSMGIFIAFLFWYPILYYTMIAFKLLKKYKPAGLLFCFSLIMLIFHAKESYLYVRMFLSIYSLMLCSLYHSIRKEYHQLN
ncbi:hypothetical protein DBR40_23270 [Pedobacter sp. KBW01]|uniref:hypothetical protein n=1 Tax=Pedobacter sp. KBW01 TaxID=2153364 RepID=UPI000F5B0C89|nr:hypothetical protein [Pedobacter sp. KBW01]RQO65699.1 hypothetical protein DBR40_23270 [Pedobacter sp. KBW01]